MSITSLKTAVPTALCLFATLPALAATTTHYDCTKLTSEGSCKPIKNFEFYKTSYNKTKYPVVLAHGMGGWSTMGSVLDYFYGVPKELAKNGASVYNTLVTQFNNTELRGEELLTQVEQILAITGEDKVNLIGHSHGAMSTRYVMNTMPEHVASVTHVAGVNRGSKTADLIVAMENNEITSFASKTIYGFLDAVGPIISFLSGEAKTDQDSKVQIHELTSAGAAAFTTRFPAGVPAVECDKSENSVKWQGISLYSFSGTQPLTVAFDPSDWLFAVTMLAFGNEPNDGLVGRCSSHFGQVIRDNYAMNHLDEVNQFFGVVNIFETNPISVYRTQVNRIKNDGN